MNENEKIGYSSYPIGADYLTIFNKENSQSLILVTLIGVEYDVAMQEVNYAFKTASGKYLFRKFGDFYELDQQKNAELKWKEHSLNKRKEFEGKEQKPND